MDYEAFQLVRKFLEEFRTEWNDLRIADVDRVKGWDEDLRYDYPLAADNVVWDIGAYMGEFAARIHCQYGCVVRMFEVVPEFREVLRRRFCISQFQVEPHGLGGFDWTYHMTDEGDRTSVYALSGNVIGEVRRCSDVLQEPVALMKVNIEGAEYDLLDDLIDTGKITLVKYLQVQFHNRIFLETGKLLEIPHAQERYESVTKRLAETHQRDWGVPWVWESWSPHEH